MMEPIDLIYGLERVAAKDVPAHIARQRKLRKPVQKIDPEFKEELIKIEGLIEHGQELNRLLAMSEFEKLSSKKSLYIAIQQDQQFTKEFKDLLIGLIKGEIKKPKNKEKTPYKRKIEIDQYFSTLRGTNNYETSLELCAGNFDISKGVLKKILKEARQDPVFKLVLHVETPVFRELRAVDEFLKNSSVDTIEEVIDARDDFSYEYRTFLIEVVEGKKKTKNKKPSHSKEHTLLKAIKILFLFVDLVLFKNMPEKRAKEEIARQQGYSVSTIRDKISDARNIRQRFDYFKNKGMTCQQAKAAVSNELECVPEFIKMVLEKYLGGVF